MTEEKALKIYNKLFSKAKNIINAKKDDWLTQYENTYIFKNTKDTSLHKVFIPMIYSTIWNVIPRMIGNEPKFIVTPKGIRVDPAKVRELQDFISEHEWKRGDMTAKVREITQNLCVYGTAFALVEWEETPLTVWSRKEGKNVPVTYDKGPKKGEQKMVGKNKVTSLDIFDVYIDPRFSNIQDSPYCIYVKHGVTMAEMKRLKYKNLDKLKNYKGRTYNNVDLDDSDRENKYQKQNFNEMNQDAVKDSYDVVYVYTKDEKGKPIRIVVSNNILLDEGPNPYPHEQYPLTKFVYQEIPNEAYGVGIAPLLEGLQDANNHTRSYRLDNVNLAIHKRFIIDESGGQIDKEQFSDFSKRWISGQNANETLTEIPVSNVTGNAYAETQQLEVDAQIAAGINNFTQDQASGFNTTATGTQLVQQLANLRINAALQNLEIGLSKLGEQMLQNTLAFQEDDLILRTIGEEDGEFNLADFEFPFDLGVESGSTSVLLEQQEKQIAGELLNSLTPFAQAGLVNPQVLVEDFIESYNKDPKKFMPQQEEQQAEAQQEEAQEEENAVPEEIINQIMNVARGENVPVQEGQPHELYIQAFREIASSDQFNRMNSESQLRIKEFIGKHQQFLTQQNGLQGQAQGVA